MPSTKNTPEDFNPAFSPEDDDNVSVMSDYSSTTDTTFADPNHEKKNRRQLYYSSNLMGSNIRNAVTGAPCPEKVGTKESLRYFRIIDSSGTCNSAGERQRRNEELNRDPNHLYYDGTLEARAHGWEVSAEIADAWRTRHTLLFPNGKLDEGIYATLFPTPERVPGLGRLWGDGHTPPHEKACRIRRGWEECTCDC